MIGAFAAVAQGYPLNTRDLDVTPDPAPDNLERLAAALIELGAKLRIPGGAVPFPIDAKMLSGAESWTLSTTAGSLDVMFAPAGTSGYKDLERDARTIVLRGLPLRFASLSDIIRMKETSNREKDRIQLPALRRTLELIRERERSMLESDS